MKHFVLPIVLGLALTACNRDNDNNSTNDAPILPIKIENNDGEVINIKYNGDKISEILNTDKDESVRGVVEYSGNLISTITYYNTTTKALDMKTVYTYDNNGKLTKAVHTEIGDNGKQYITTNSYTYKNDGTINKVSTNNDNSSSSVSTITITNGNFIKEVRVSTNEKTTYTYKYDTANNPFKNVKGFTALLLENDEDNTLNNVLEKMEESSFGITYTTYSYKYNTNNYPTEKTRIYNPNNSEVTTYTYNK